MSTKGLSPWSGLYIHPDKAEPREIDLTGLRIQLRADATSFRLWVTDPATEDGPYVAEVDLLGAKVTSVTEAEVSYEGYLDESRGLFGNADGSRTVRKTTVMLLR